MQNLFKFMQVYFFSAKANDFSFYNLSNETIFSTILSKNEAILDQKDFRVCACI